MTFIFFFFFVSALQAWGLMAAFDYCVYTVWPNCTNCQRISFFLIAFILLFLPKCVSYFCAVLNGKYKYCVAKKGKVVVTVDNIDKYWQVKLIKLFQTEHYCWVKKPPLNVYTAQTLHFTFRNKQTKTKTHKSAEVYGLFVTEGY